MTTNPRTVAFRPAVLTSNMRAVYLEEQTRHYRGLVLDSTRLNRRNNAAATLRERCGYDNTLMRILDNEAKRQAGVR